LKTTGNVISNSVEPHAKKAVTFFGKVGFMTEQLLVVLRQLKNSFF
jgi:hypothetical protein